MTYVLQKKNLPAPPVADESVEDQEAVEQTTDDAREWSGEPYEGADAPQGPEGAYSVFSHPGGESAWLDRAEDGTLTGWVMAADGTLYQYTDADAWAVDVDGAEMAMVQGQGPTGDASEVDEASMEDQQADVEAVEDAAAGESDLLEPDPAEGLPAGEEVDPAAEGDDWDDEELDDELDDDAEGELDEEAPTGEEDDLDLTDDDYLDAPELDEDESDDDEEDDEEDPFARFRKGTKGKYLMLVTTKD